MAITTIMIIKFSTGINEGIYTKEYQDYAMFMFFGHFKCFG